MEKTISIIGVSISACIAACYLKLKNPSIRVRMLGRSDQRMPIVGESLTEYSTFLLHEIGLGAYLEEYHFHKYGLSFYFKEDIENPKDRTYAVHEARAIPPMPANLINRFEFDKKIMEHALELGVEIIDARVLDIKRKSNNSFELFCRRSDKTTFTFDSDFLIDASGRNRFLTRHLKLPKAEPAFQRSSFWFWVKDFDPALLSQLKAIKDSQPPFNTYYVTHHFMGKGNWIWVIPISSANDENLVSIGIVWRPDIFHKEISTVEEFLQQADSEHPVVADFVRSGKIQDQFLYRNYLHDSEQLYSPEGWFLLGDAGFSVDPLYSTGLVMTSIQTTQINQIIQRTLAGTLTSSYRLNIENALTTMRKIIQFEIAKLYEVMHDPYQVHWRVHFSSTFYFFSLLPLWMSGFLVDEKSSLWFKKFLEQRTPNVISLLGLLAEGSSMHKHLSAGAPQLKNKYDRSVNWKLTGPRENDIPGYLAKMHWLFAGYRWELLKNAAWKNWKQHFKFILQDLMATINYRFFFRIDSIREANSRMSEIHLGKRYQVAPKEKAQATVISEIPHLRLASGSD